MAAPAGAVILLLLCCSFAVDGSPAPPAAASTSSAPSSSSSSSAACPEDSVAVDGGKCKCVSPCPKHDCRPGQRPVRLREASPESPGRCCPLYECRNQASLSYSTEEATARGDCLDDSDQVRANGTSWQELGDPCVECSCDSGRRDCRSSMCRSCENPLPQLADECCPRCPPLPTEPPIGCPELLEECDPAGNGCELLGPELDPDTGCPRCRCRPVDHHQNEVNEVSTEEAPVVVEDPEKACQWLDCDDLVCPNGRLTDDRGCAVCQCRPARCPDNLVCRTNCPQGYRTDAHGCPSCECLLGVCLDEANVTHPEGSSWRPEACRSCACEPGARTFCNETICSVGCAEPLPPAPGRCCPVCPDHIPGEWRGWDTAVMVLITGLALLCVLLMVRLVRSRFRGTPAESDFIGYSQQYYKCVPIYEPHLPVLQHAKKIAPL